MVEDNTMRFIDFIIKQNFDSNLHNQLIWNTHRYSSSRLYDTIDNIGVRSTSTMIGHAFRWAKTYEGVFYWAAISRNLKTSK